MEYLWVLILGAVIASVVWWFILTNNKKRFGDFLQDPTKFFDGVKQELAHMEDDVREKVLKVLDNVNQTIGKK